MWFWSISSNLILYNDIYPKSPEKKIKKESFQNFIHKSLPKNLKFKKHLKLWGFWQNYKILQYTTWGQKIFFDFQIFNLTPFCNLKRYFCVFHQFIHKSLPKNLKFKKRLKLWGFWQNYKIIQYTTLGQKIFFHFQILFLTPFCNLKLYFRVFDHFVHKSLPKNQKFKKPLKLWGFWQNY